MTADTVTPIRPLLPLSIGTAIFPRLFDAKMIALSQAEAEWAARACNRHAALERQNRALRLALREAIDNLEGYMGAPSAMDENELGLLMSLYSTLGRRERKAFERRFAKECAKSRRERTQGGGR